MCKIRGSVLLTWGPPHFGHCYSSSKNQLRFPRCPSHVLYGVPMALSLHPPPIPLWRPWKTFSDILSVTCRSQGLGGAAGKTLSAETCFVAIVTRLQPPDVATEKVRDFYFFKIPPQNICFYLPCRQRHSCYAFRPTNLPKGSSNSQNI